MFSSSWAFYLMRWSLPEEWIIFSPRSQSELRFLWSDISFLNRVESSKNRIPLHRFCWCVLTRKEWMSSSCLLLLHTPMRWTISLYFLFSDHIGQTEIQAGSSVAVRCCWIQSMTTILTLEWWQGGSQEADIINMTTAITMCQELCSVLYVTLPPLVLIQAQWTGRS